MSIFSMFARRSRQQAAQRRRPRATRLGLESLEARTMVTADLMTGVPLALYSTDTTSAADTAPASPLADTAKVAQFTLKITDSKDQVITGPLIVGQTFWVDIMIQDVRTSFANAGVAQAGTDVLYNSVLASPTGTVTAGPNYPFGLMKDLSVPGKLGNINATEQFDISHDPPFAPLGSGVELLARVQMTATAAGDLTFTTQIPSAQSVIVADATGTTNAQAGNPVQALADAEIGGASTSITIVNVPSATLQGNNVVTAGASQTTIPFTVNLSNAIGQPITFNYQTQITGSDNAVPGTDFTAVQNGTVTVGAGATSATISINVAAQSQFQSDRTFHVALTGVNANSTGLATIDNSANAALGTIHFTQPSVSVANSSVTENTSAATNMVFTVSLSGPSALPTTVQYKTESQSGDLAVGGADITTPGVDYKTTAGSLMIDAGATSGTITIPISAQSPGPNKTFHLVLEGATNGTLSANSTAVGTIINNVSEPSVSVGGASAANGPAGTTISFPVTLTGAVNQDVKLNYQTAILSGDNAVPGTDFTAVANGQLVIPANSTTGTISIQILGTSHFDVTKTFHVSLSVDPTSASLVTLGASSALGTITNTNAQPSLAVGDATIGNTAAGATLTFPVTLNGGALNQPLTINYQTQNLANDAAVPGVDYTPSTNGQVTIPAGSTTANITIPVLGTTVFKPTLTFHLNLSLDAASAPLATIADGSAVGTITNSIVAPTVVAQPGNATLTSSTPSSMSFVVVLQDANGAPVTSGQDVTVQYRAVSQSGDTAVGGTDLNAQGVDYFKADTSTNTSPLVIPAGQNSGTITIPLAAGLAGPNKTFHLEITGVSGGGTLGTAKTALGTITNNIAKPTASIQATATQSAPASGTQSMQFKVTLSAPSSENVVFNYSTTNGTAVAGTDFQAPAANAQVTIPAFQTSATISIPILANATLATSKTFQVNLTELPNGASHGTLAVAQGTGTITPATGSFAGHAYIDTNNDGVRGAQEQALPGVTVTLTGTSLAGANIQMTQTTGADGAYKFADVPLGSYSVTEVLPSQYLQGKATAGAGANAVANNQFSVVINGGNNLVENNFAARGLQSRLITKGLFLGSTL